MKILVLGGGNSPEREVSLRSAKSVAQAARTAGFAVQELDPAAQPAFYDNLDKDTIVFPILHGAGGEDGVLQKQLEKRDFAFLGSGSSSSDRCFDKLTTRQELAAAGLPVPAGGLVAEQDYPSHALAHRPHVLKVVHGGSSIGTLIIRDPNIDHSGEVKQIFGLGDDVLIEELIEGTELTVPILDNTALPVIEIVPPPHGEFDYDNKYNGQSQEICPPSSVGQDLQKQARKLAERVHKIMDCRHLSRVDIMLDKDSKLFLLEVNTMPGLTDQSLYPKSAKTAGIEMPSLVRKFADMIKRDYNL
ncbi:MAG TPA: D-alanine--D-alanine ligase [Candidatus Saccharimonadales bacterium]|nr:D-alanine--D-alanine ligase [Candidatus Saccharimonadales bacterium]